MKSERGIMVDGKFFDVPMVSLKRSADFLDKLADRTEEGDLHRELIGVYYNFTLTAGDSDDFGNSDYDSFWDKMTEPVEFHNFSIPTKDGWYDFVGYPSSVSDEYKKIMSNGAEFTGFTCKMTAKKAGKETKMKTSFGVIYELKDTTAIADSTPSTMNNMSFANESLLKENETFPDYQTLEQDYFLLDGTMPELPDEPKGVPFWTSELSGADGTFEENPVLTILFTENHTSAGLTFHFVGDVPLLMKVRWYELNGNLMEAKTYEPDAQDYFCKGLVENYGKVEAEFIKANPYRYVKLYGLEYGTTIEWNEKNIKSASLVEETDMLSNTLKANKLIFQFFDMADEFDVTNEDGLHKTLQKNQYMEPYEMVDGEKIALGRYFLQSPSNSKKLTKIEATDYIGLLDNSDFMDGRVYSGEPAGTVLEELFAGTGIDYEVDEDVAAVPLYGWLKVQSRRKALREILFACGACAETAQRTTLHIFRPDRKVHSVIRRSRKFSTAAKQDDYVSDVNVKIATYEPETEEKEIVRATMYPAGEHMVQFSSPIANARVTAGEIVKAATNYLVFKLTSEAEVSVYGVAYEKQEMTAVSSVAKLKAGENRKTKSYTSTLCSYAQAKKVADKILDYYQLTLILNVKYLAEREEPCDWAEIENPAKERGSYVAGIESMTTDLTGGYVATAKLRGYYKPLTNYSYTGMELYTGESVGEL